MSKPRLGSKSPLAGWNSLSRMNVSSPGVVENSMWGLEQFRCRQAILRSCRQTKDLNSAVLKSALDVGWLFPAGSISRLSSEAGPPICVPDSVDLTDTFCEMEMS